MLMDLTIILMDANYTYGLLEQIDFTVDELVLLIQLMVVQ